jgi:hypothetical protein
MRLLVPWFADTAVTKIQCVPGCGMEQFVEKMSG